MTKKDPSQEETTLTPVLEEPTSASGVNFGQKVFANTETGITIEVEGLSDAAVDAPAEEAVPLVEEPPAPRTPAPPAKALAASTVNKNLALDNTQTPVSPSQPASPKSVKSSFRLNAAPISPAAVIIPSERTPFFSPAVIAIAVAAAGFYFYQRSSHRPAPVIAPVAVTVPAPEPIKQTSVPPASPVINLNKPVAMAVIEDESAVYVLKSDSDDFRVLVNGKDMPVISGKITLPLNQALDISFVRRGYKDIKMSVNLKKAEVKDVTLKFEKDPNAPPPRRLYN